MLSQVGPQHLQDVPLFNHLTPDEVGQILARCETIACREGEIVFHAGDSQRALYLLIEGLVEVVLEVPGLQEAVVTQLEPKSVFGEASFFHTAPHAATVRCRTAATLARLVRSEFDALLADDALAAYRLALNAAEILAARLHTTDEWVVELLSEEQVAVTASWRRFRERIGGSFESPRGFVHT